MILPDTSIWIDLLSRSREDILPEDYEQFFTCGPVLQEVLQGLRDIPASDVYRSRFLRLRRLDDPVPIDAFLEAADIFRIGRKRGYTIRSSIDCLIAAIAIRNGVSVWHKDRDYDTIARFTPLRVMRSIR